MYFLPHKTPRISTYFVYFTLYNISFQCNILAISSSADQQMGEGCSSRGNFPKNESNLIWMTNLPYCSNFPCVQWSIFFASLSSIAIMSLWGFDEEMVDQIRNCTDLPNHLENNVHMQKKRMCNLGLTWPRSHWSICHYQLRYCVLCCLLSGLKDLYHCKGAVSPRQALFFA